MFVAITVVPFVFITLTMGVVIRVRRFACGALVLGCLFGMTMSMRLRSRRTCSSVNMSHSLKPVSKSVKFLFFFSLLNHEFAKILF